MLQVVADMKDCQFCGVPSPIVAHAFCTEGHCERRECIAKCQSCQDWIEAVGDGSPMIQNVGTSQQVPTVRAEPKPGSFSKAPGYEALMKRMKGGS